MGVHVGIEAVLGEIGIVQIVILEVEEWGDKPVRLKPIIKSIGINGRFVESGAYVRHAQDSAQVEQMELRYVGTQFLLTVVQINHARFRRIQGRCLEMLVPVLVSEVEIGHARSGIGISQIQLWAVTQFCCEIEFRAVEFFLVNANAREQGSTFLGVVAHT